MQNETFEPGQELYLDNGYLVEYICRIDSGHIVCQVSEVDDEEEPYYGDPFFTRQVFKSPPSARQEHRIADLESEIEEKKKELREVCSELWDAQNSQKKMLEVLKRNEALAQIENALDGQITHVVIKGWPTWDIYEIHSNAYKDRWTAPIFELRINFQDKSIKWGFTAKDEHRSSRDCYLFKGYEDAKAFIHQKILSEVNEEEIGAMSSYAIENIVDNATKWQISLPEFFIAAHRKNQLDARKKAQVDAQAQLDKANKALAELGGGDDA